MSERRRDQPRNAATKVGIENKLAPGKRSLTDLLGGPMRSRAVETPGKRTLADVLPVQKRSLDGAPPSTVRDPHQAAADGVAGASSPLPFASEIQRAFGKHDLGHVRTQVGGAAADAGAALGAHAYARGEQIAFSGTPDLHTAAHEAAHVIQQRRGVSATDGVGHAGDVYERHADQVAQRVVAGQSAEELLDTAPQGAATEAIQKDSESVTATKYIELHEAKLVVAAHNTAMAGPFAINSAYGKLANGHSFAVSALTGVDTIKRIRELFIPERLEETVDRIRLHSTGKNKDTEGPAEWMESVGTAIGAKLAEKIQASLNRVLPRYVDARFQALLAEEAKEGNCMVLAPEPAAEDVLVSHPIDRNVAAALCTGCITFDHETYRTAHPDGKPEFKKPRTVNLGFEAATKGAYWIRVEEKEPTTAEDVALTLFGAPEHAYEVTGIHPLYGFTHASKLVEPHRGYLESRGEDLNAEADPNEVLQDPKNNLGALADEQAQLQSQGAATGSSKDEIVQKMRLNLQSLDEVIALAGKFELSDRLTTVRAKLDTKSQECAKPETPFAQVAKWDGQVNLQALSIQRANFGLDAVRERLDGMTKGMENLPPKFSEIKLPDYVRATLLKVANAFVAGAALCETPATADAKLSEAEQLAVFASVELLDGMLTEIVRVLHEEAKEGHSGDFGNHKAYTAPDTQAVASKEILLRQELATIRPLILSNPTAAGVALKELSAKVQDLSSEAEIIGNMDELDRLWSSIQSAALRTNGPALDQTSAEANAKRAAERSRELRGRCDGFYARWQVAYKKYKDGDKDGAKTLVDGIKKDPELAKFLADCNQLFSDAADMAVVNKLALLFGITILTMGVGTWVEGIAVGLELGTGATILAVSAAEAVTFVALSQAFLDTDHSVGHIATELAFNFAMFSALRRFSKFIEAANMAKAVKIGVTFTGQTVIATAAGLAKTEIETYVHTGKYLTEAQVKQICLESVVQAVALTLVSYGFEPIMTELQSAGKELGTSIKIANEKAAAVKQMTKALEGKKSIEDALQTIKAHREWAEAKLEAFKQLEKAIEAERTNPPKKGESIFEKTKLTPEQIATLKGSIAEAMATMKAAEAILTLEPTGPNTFQCPKERVAKVLQELGGKPLSETEDAVTKLKTYTVKAPDGRVIKIVETSLGPNPSGQPGTTGGPALDLVHLPESSQSIARWQADGITREAPKTWEQTAKDGRTFKDVYAEWMKQSERVRKKPDGTWEAVLPKDCPPEFKLIFEKMVAEGNITQATSGEANVAKLKEAGIDLSKLDPLSPEYLSQRDKIISILGEDAVHRWEASKTETASAEKADVAKRVSSVVAPSDLGALRSAFPDCEIILTGSISQTGKPLTGPKGIKELDVVLVVPKDTPMENRIAMEKRASGMKIPTTPEFQKAGGAAELSVDAKAMLPEEYLGIRTADPGKRGTASDLRIDEHVAKAEDVAKQYNVGNDPAQLKTWEAIFQKNPVEAAKWAHEMKDVPGLAGRLLGRFGEAALGHFKPTGSGTFSIHGEIEIAGAKLGSLNDADIPRLVEVCQKKGPVTEFEYFEGSESKTKPGYRLRFPKRLADRADTAAKDVLKAMGLDPNKLPEIFKNMTPDDQSRMWDLKGEGEFGNKAIREQAGKWALGKGPKSAREFVALFQFYAAEIGRRTNEIVSAFEVKVDAEVKRIEATGASVDRKAVTEQLAKSEFGTAASSPEKIRSKAREKAVVELGGAEAAADGSPSTVGANRAGKALKTNLEAQNDGDAAGAKDIGEVSTAELEVKIKAVADTLSFGNSLDAAYHAHKHALEMASPPSADQEMVVYLHAARNTIKNGTGQGAKPAQMSAGRSLTFIDAAGNKCIVYIGPDGNAQIATYLPNH